jgi:hypothetical protein
MFPRIGSWDGNAPHALPSTGNSTCAGLIQAALVGARWPPETVFDATKPAAASGRAPWELAATAKGR